MLLYDHWYSGSKTHKLVITPIEVTETAKQFKSNSRDFSNYKKVINKNEIDKLTEGWNSYSMVSLAENSALFVQLIKAKREEKLKQLKESVEQYTNEITYLSELSAKISLKNDSKEET